MAATTSVPWICNDRDAARYALWYEGPETAALACDRCGSFEDVSAAGRGDGVPLCLDCLEWSYQPGWEAYYDEIYGGR